MVVLANICSIIKNGENVGKSTVVVKPLSKLVRSMLSIFKELDYIKEVEFIENRRGGEAKITLKGKINDVGEITPNFYIGVDDLIKFEKRYLPAEGFGRLILTTSKGIITNDKAKELNVGGKLLAYIY